MRRVLHEAISDAIAEDPQLSDGVVSGWTLIVEQVHPNQRYSLSQFSSDATGSGDLMPWTTIGWLMHVAQNPEDYIYSSPDDEE